MTSKNAAAQVQALTRVATALGARSIRAVAGPGAGLPRL